VVANFGFDVSDQADFGAFRVGYDGRLVLKGGSLELRDDGTIRLRELDARWDKLDFSLAVKLPEISFGGGLVEVPLGSILVPGTGVFSGGKTVTFTVHLAPLVEHELSLVGSPLIQHFKPGVTPIGKHCQDLHTALDIDDTKQQWRVFCDPQTIDFDLFDFADTVGDLFEEAFTGALDAALPRGLLHDLILAGIGSIADLLRTLLDIPDDISEWLSDLFNVSLGSSTSSCSSWPTSSANAFPSSSWTTPTRCSPRPSRRASSCGASPTARRGRPWSGPATTASTRPRRTSWPASRSCSSPTPPPASSSSRRRLGSRTGPGQRAGAAGPGQRAGRHETGHPVR
jgi:hypothetical protein